MPWSASRRPNSESHAPGKVDVQANWPLLHRSAGVRRVRLTWPNVVTGMPWRVPLWEKESPGRKPGENREASYQQCARSKSGSASNWCGAGADYALRPSTAFVERLLQHESVHIESVTVADATEGHFPRCKGAAIAAGGLSQEWRQVECKLQGNQQSSQGLAFDLASASHVIGPPLDAFRRPGQPAPPPDGPGSALAGVNIRSCCLAARASCT